VNSFDLALSSDVPLNGIVVKQASLSYRSTSAGDVWTGAVDVDLPAGMPELSGTLTVTNGQVSQVGITANKIDKPVGEIVFLQSLGLSVTLHPHFSATGSVGLTAGPEVDGVAAVGVDASLTADFGNPFKLIASGTVSVVDQKIASASLTFTVPSSLSLDGDVSRDLLGVTVDGHIGGAITPNSFEAEGGVSLKGDGLSATGDALVNNVGIAACGSEDVLWGTVNIGGAHRWHGGDSLLQGSCGFTQLKNTLGARDAADAGVQQVITVPPDQRQVNVIVKGDGAPPSVLLVNGSTRKVIAPGTQGSFGRAVYLAMGIPDENETAIAVGEPPSGALGVGPASGEPQLASIGSTTLLPAPKVRTAIKSLGSNRYRLSWTGKALDGQRLVFVDVDRHGQSQILATSRATGSTTFVGRDVGLTAFHQIRVLVEQQGLLRLDLPGNRFRATAVPVGTPRVTIGVQRSRATVRWAAVSGALGYRVFITTSDGRSLFFSYGPHRHSVTVPAASVVHARVQAIGPGWVNGHFGVSITRKRR